MKSARQAGFTIIELVVVIVILGILAAVAVPQFAGVQASAYTAAEQNACISLQSQAVMEYASKRAVPTVTEIKAAAAAGTFTDVAITGATCALNVKHTAAGNAASAGYTCNIPTNICTP